MPSCIYQIINKINGKSYVGFDSHYPKQKRINDHKRCDGSSPLLHKAIKKYGWKNFTHKILYIGENLKHTLNVIEPFFIKLYNTKNPNGYNLTNGGEGSIGIKRSKETKKRISLSQTGKPATKGRTGMVGIFLHSENTKNKMAKSHSKKWKIIFPDGHIENILNMNKFCKENKITVSNLNVRGYSKGYRCLGELING